VIAPLSNIEVEFANPHKQGELYAPESVTDWRRPANEKLDLAFAPHRLPEGRTPIGLDLGGTVTYGLDISLGATMYYIGLFAPLNIPMARSGTIGAINVPTIRHSDPYDYPAHLVDVRSYGGFSGSPCFIEYPLANLTPLDLSQLPVRLPWANPEEEAESKGRYGGLGFLHLFAGMFTEHYDPQNPARAASVLGIGVVLPADPIIEALMTDDLRKERFDADDAFLRENPTLTADAASVEGDATEFGRFEDLTDKLLRVPKKELDDKLKES
jgi:hypothetical protein